MNNDPSDDVLNTPVTEPEQAEQPRTVPLEALEATRKELQALKAWRSEQEAATAAAALKSAEEQGKWRELYESLQPEVEGLKAQLGEFTTARDARLSKVAEENASAISLLPPELQMMPGLKSSNPDEVASALNWLRDHGTGQVARGGVVRPAAGGVNGLTPAQLAFAKADYMLAPKVEDGTISVDLVAKIMKAKGVQP